MSVSSLQESALSKEDMLVFLEQEFPQVFGATSCVEIVDLHHGDVVLHLHARDEHLRPGGTISGPIMMMLADCAAYICVLSVVGKVALAVTTNLNINFLRKPPLDNLICHATPLKIGKSLFVAETELYSASDPDKKRVAHATLTYSIPPGST